MEYRPAAEADLAGEYAVYAAAEEELRARRGARWPTGLVYDPAGEWATIHRHLLTHDGERSFVAEEDELVVGFTAAFVRAGCWFLAALFIDPAAQGRGVGRNLLDLAWSGSYERRLTITEAIQPVSTGLYAGRGLLPVTPVLSFAGRPRIPTVAELEPGMTDAASLRLIDLAAYGFDRAIDHELWGRTSARATLWSRAGEPVAYSYERGSLIGPLAGLTPRDAAQALQAELARSGDFEVSLDLPGSATAVVEVALAAGLRLNDPGLLLISPGDHPPPKALAIHSYWLF